MLFLLKGDSLTERLLSMDAYYFEARHGENTFFAGGITEVSFISTSDLLENFERST